jgi:hypothetical protein
MDPLTGNTSGALEPDSVSTKRERIATLATKRRPWARASSSNVGCAMACCLRVHCGRTHKLRSRMR